MGTYVKSFICNILHNRREGRASIDGKAQKRPEGAETTLFRRWNAVDAHVWAKHLRDKDGTIGLLIILDECDPSAANRQPRTVERMHKVALAAAFGLETDARAARLKGFTIRAGRNFAKFIAGRQPHLEVVRFRGSKTHVAGAKQHGAMMQAESLKNRFGISHQSFEFFITLLRVRKLKELDFLELMLAE